jgi:hypothetical protein
MISKALADKILSTTRRFWNAEVEKRYFQDLAKGKEIGHRIADLVDEKTTSLLSITANFVTRHQYDDRGKKRSRSMGDIWVESNGIFHPVNVKTGVSDSGGQPNMVSLKKVLHAFLTWQIDAYYLLMVKPRLGERIACAVYFVDMLDYLDYFTFDSGPGQIMLKSDDFFEAMTRGEKSKARSIAEKVDGLMKMYEDGERRLALNRKQDLDSFRQMVSQYRKLGRHEVTPETQASLNLR